MSRRYTDREKAEYYKRLAASRTITGRGAYRVSRSAAAYGRARPIRGMGAYKAPSAKPAKSRGRPLSTTAGTALGGAVGSLFGPGGTAVGSALGALGGNALGELMGWGEYHVNRNSIYQAISEGNSPARMHTSKSTLRLQHREYVTDIISSSSANTFQLQSFPINPGLVQTLPWASAIASQFEEYDILGMVYEFKTLSADAIANTTNTALGYVVMATDYNAINGNFVNKQQMENTEYTTSCKPSISMYHAIECDPGANPLNKLYIRSGAVPANSDQRLYDLGIFQIATSCPGTSVVLGELWCSYDIELKKPISTNALGQDVLTDHFYMTGNTAAHPLGTAQTLRANSSIGGTINGATGTNYAFPSIFQEGSYLFTVNINGTVPAAVTAPSITVTNGTLESVWLNDTASSVNNNASTSGNLIYMFVVSITGLNCSIQFGASGAYPTGTPQGDIWVTQADSNIIT